MESRYPAIYNYLLQFEETLKARGQVRYTSSKKEKLGGDYKGQHHRLELDNNPTLEKLDDFSRQKIMYGEISQSPCFSYDESGLYVSNTGYILVGEHLKYLCVLLNSKFISFIFKNFYSINLGSKGYRYLAQYMVNLPIPIPSVEIDTKFSEILDSETRGDNVDENTIDKMIYGLYGLSDEEIQYVEKQTL